MAILKALLKILMNYGCFYDNYEIKIKDVGEYYDYKRNS